MSTDHTSPGVAGRTYVVGGASRGLGFAVARELTTSGARVLLVARGGDALEQARGELGADAHALCADLTAGDAAGRVAEAARTIAPEGIDGLLINAGGPPRGSVLELDDAAWAAAYQLLIGAPIRLVRALSGLLRDGSAVLFVTSSSVREHVPGVDASNVLRPGVAALVRSLARELAPGVRVNAVAPGRFDTARALEGDRRRAAAAGSTVEDERARGAAAIPLGRYGEPAELARAAVFLLSPAASYISGTTLHIDGGLVSSAP